MQKEAENFNEQAQRIGKHYVLPLGGGGGAVHVPMVHI